MPENVFGGNTSNIDSKKLEKRFRKSFHRSMFRMDLLIFRWNNFQWEDGSQKYFFRIFWCKYINYLVIFNWKYLIYLPLSEATFLMKYM